MISFFPSFLVHRSLCVLVLKLYYQILEYTILILFVLCKNNNFRISGLYVLTPLSVGLAVLQSWTFTLKKWIEVVQLYVYQLILRCVGFERLSRKLMSNCLIICLVGSDVNFHISWLKKFRIDRGSSHPTYLFKSTNFYRFINYNPLGLHLS